MIDSIEKAKLWMCDCGRSNDDDVGGGGVTGDECYLIVVVVIVVFTCAFVFSLLMSSA